MGKCYFFPASDATDEAAQARLMTQVKARRAEQAGPRYGFRTGFRPQRGAGGRKKWQPVVDVREIAGGEKMGKYAEIPKDLYRQLLPHNGADLLAFETAEAAAERLVGSHSATPPVEVPKETES
jgi:hypothetical protein